MSTDHTIELVSRNLDLWLAPTGDGPSSAAFVSSVLSRYRVLAGLQLRFTRSAHGKPALQDSPVNVHFNLSHSGPWKICAVSADMPVGVDVQRADVAGDVDRLIARFFSSSEQAALADLQPSLREARFYDLWALKEAGVKARGEALAEQLARRRFHWDYAHERTPSVINAYAGATPDRASYLLLRWPDGYHSAICMLGDPPREVRLFRCAGERVDGAALPVATACTDGWPCSER